MPPIADKAVVLRRLDFAETSQVLALFTRDHGKVRVIAKGARRGTRRRFEPGIDLLESGDVVFSVRSVGQEALGTVTEWRATRSFLGLRSRLDRLQPAQYAADALARLTEDWDAHPGLYRAVLALFEHLADTDEPLAHLTRFQRTLLQETGHQPRLDACVGCNRTIGRRGDVYFSSFDGGLLCRDCEGSRMEKRLLRVSPAVLQGHCCERFADVVGVFDVYHYHLSHLMGRPPAAGAQLLDDAVQALTREG